MSESLASDRLNVEVSPPGALYTGARFDWTTQVRQITFDGRPLLTQERENEPSPAAQGWGLAGEFGIETPVGFEDCAVGGLFSKIGVGLLKRPDDKPYHFGRAYEVKPARFGLRPEGESALLITAEQAADRGYGWLLKRHWSVKGAELKLTTTLTNTASRPIATEEYNHNFFAFETATDWALNLPRPVVRDQMQEVNDKESLLDFGPPLTWNKTATRDFFLSDQRPGTPSTWTLVGRELSITESLDLPATRFSLWGRGHVVSPELYCRIEVAPGASLAWTRQWTFQTADVGKH